MTDHDKASAIADKLRNITLFMPHESRVFVTAEDVLAKVQSDAELDYYYRIIIAGGAGNGYTD